MARKTFIGQGFFKIKNGHRSVKSLVRLAGVQAPLILEMSGKEMIWCAMFSFEAVFNAWIVSAPSTVNRPDFVRRSDAR